MDTLIFTFTKHSKGRSIVDCKVTGEHAQKMFCSPVGQSFANLWKGKEEAVEESKEEIGGIATVPSIVDAESIEGQSSTQSQVDATMFQTVGSTIPKNNVSIHQPTVNVGSNPAPLPKLTTTKRPLESTTTPKDDITHCAVPNKSLTFYTARPNKDPIIKPAQMPAVVVNNTRNSSPHLLLKDKIKARMQFKIHLSDASQVINVDIPSTWTGSQEELCVKVKSMWE